MFLLFEVNMNINMYMAGPQLTVQCLSPAICVEYFPYPKFICVIYFCTAHFGQVFICFTNQIYFLTVHGAIAYTVDIFQHSTDNNTLVMITAKSFFSSITTAAANEQREGNIKTVVHFNCPLFQAPIRLSCFSLRKKNTQNIINRDENNTVDNNQIK